MQGQHKPLGASWARRQAGLLWHASTLHSQARHSGRVPAGTQKLSKVPSWPCLGGAGLTGPGSPNSRERESRGARLSPACRHSLPGQLPQRDNTGAGTGENPVTWDGWAGWGQRETERPGWSEITMGGGRRSLLQPGGQWEALRQRTQQKAEGGARDKDPEKTQEIATPTPRDTQATCSLACRHPDRGHLW